MCIIIDTNTLASVFNQASLNHSNFKPVLDWIYSGNGKIVYGGTRYESEIKNYLGIFNELNKMNRAIKVNNPDWIFRSKLTPLNRNVFEQLKWPDWLDSTDIPADVDPLK